MHSGSDNQCTASYYCDPYSQAGETKICFTNFVFQRMMRSGILL